MDYTPYYETMRRTSLLRGMTDAELDTLMACFAPRVRRYAKGELLLMAGYETHEVGLVLEGAITASKPLADGDSVTVVKDLKVKGSSSMLKIGTKVKNIRLVEGDHNIDCKIDGFGAMKLKSEFVKKI